VKLKDLIYSFDNDIARVLFRINHSELDEKSRKILNDFYSDCVVQSLSKARTLKCLGTMFRVARWFGKPLDEVGKDDIVAVIRRIEESDYTGWTKHDYKAIIKSFFRWLRQSEEYPPEVKWIRTNVRNASKLPEELLTVEEVRRIVDAADSMRDKALVMLLYESGCRIGEILTLQLKHVQFDRYGAVMLVDGKTGQRRVRIVFSAPRLMQWIENHPMKDDPEAPLWVTHGSKRRRPLLYASFGLKLHEFAIRAGIKKRVHAHLFRHSRATHLATVLTEAQMKQYFGWVQSSDMASTYVHLSGRDVDDALLKLNGLAVKDEEKQDMIKAVVCPRCRERNSPDAKFCPHCGMCLDEKTAVEIDDARLKADELMNELVKRPEILEQMLHAVEAIKD